MDVVYTWVNDKDPIWLEKKNKYNEIQNNIECSGDKARFENHNELYYSIYSVRKFMPWIRNIFIVTDDQIPSWFQENYRIFIVDHKEIIDQKYLPTFNSHVIEAHLHKIENLSENFIYFNDDVMVAKQLSKSHFFRNNGIVSVFTANKSLDEMNAKGVKTPTQYASKNSNEIIFEKFGQIIDTPLVHTYVPLKKSVFDECYQENIVKIEKFLNNKFRGQEDINLATFLVPWSMYLSGKSVITSEICYYFNIRSPHALMQYKKLNSKKVKSAPHSICVNDFKVSDFNLDDYKVNLTKFLNRYYFK